VREHIVRHRDSVADPLQADVHDAEGANDAARLQTVFATVAGFVSGLRPAAAQDTRSEIDVTSV
jgi:hypothetical protein